MNSLLPLLFILLPVVVAQLEIGENTINLHTNWRKKASNECNIYDESAYCQQVVVDQRMSLVAVSHRCSCPEKYRCPDDITDTTQVTQCEWDEERHWNRCRMRCVPKEE